MNAQRSIVLVTGSNGRIGRAVMERLGPMFTDVVGFDLSAPSPPPPGCTRIPVDISSEDSVRKGLRVVREHHGTRIASVVHLAAYYDFLGKASPKYDSITVEGTRRLLAALRDGGFEVEQFLFTSTMLVHKPAEPGEFINEDWPLGPTWAYPESKVRTEALIHEERERIPATILRLAGAYDDVCHSPPLAHQIQRIYERQLASRLYSGETSHGQAFVHLDDVVDAIQSAIERRAALPPEVAILIGEREALSYDELQHTFMRLIHGKSAETRDVPKLIAKVGAWLQDHTPGMDPFIKPWMIDRANDHYALDINRARELLDWSPRHTLRGTLPKMVEALKADPLGWYREHGLDPPSSMKKAAAHAVKEQAHTCAMHPGVVQDAAGCCPRCGEALQPTELAAKVEYTCPMHPEVVSDRPGRCPKCGMKLELRASTGGGRPGHSGEGDAPQASPAQLEACNRPTGATPDVMQSSAHEAHGGHSAVGTQYTCPMHPEVVSDRPGQCPKCGMTLVPRSAAGDHGGGVHASAGHEAGHGDMMVDEHRKLLWPHYLNLMLGLWLLTSPLTLGYLSDFAPDANQLRVMTERGLPSFEVRNLAMTWSDLVCGVLVVIFSVLSASAARRFPWAQWANAFVGGWLLFAPLVFWTPLPEAYANDTLIGALVIAFSVLVPMMPGMSMAGMMGKPDIPPGWTYTPSSWLQRAPIAVLALIGLFIARALGAYQLGHVDSVWEPFFPGHEGMNGTEVIITSDVSKAWPIADGALGAVVYMLELVMTWMGGKDRWRTMPWMVLALAILILPLGIVSIYFIIIQPIVIGTWCTLCLVAALAMAVMIPYSLDEFVAMGQFLAWARRQGKPFWRTFWMGDAMEGGSDDTSKGLLGSAREQIGEAGRGMSFPLTLWISIAIGVWLTFTRLTFDTSGTMAYSDHLIGALVVTFSIMAFAEVGRALRFINIPFGAWLIAAPWLLNGIASPWAVWNGVISGVLLIVLAIPRGRVKESYAGWNRYIV